MSVKTTPLLAAAAAVIACALVADAAPPPPPPDYGLNWVTIDHPGNRAPTPDEVWFANPDYDYGAVDYTFRMTQTPVTLGQYFEFVEAYVPFADDPNVEFGFQIWNLPDEDPFIIPGSDPDWAVEAPLRMAKRMANWMHNGKVNEKWAFESGAYDTSTFGKVDGAYTDQVEPSPGATYWIPDLNEWSKANYYDPNRYGPGEEGYWLYPHQSQDPPIPGLPSEGGETDAGLDGEPGIDFPFFPVGSYSDVQSYFGVLDASGGEVEMTGSHFPFTTLVAYGTSKRGGAIENTDELGAISGTSPTFGGFTFRLASVPNPGTTALLTITPLIWRRKR